MNYLIKKTLQLLGVLLMVSFLSFVLLDLLPGDVVDVRCGLGCTTEQREELRTELGLDDPVPVQYLRWLQDVVIERDLGVSLLNQQPVLEAIGQKLPVTLLLVIYSQVIALGIGLPLGMISARKPGSFFDRFAAGLSGVFISVPNFVWAFLFILVFSLTLDMFPSIMSTNVSGVSYLYELFLPALSLALAELAIYSRLLRNDLISTLQEDYITMAKAKGLPARRIIRKHALRPSTFSLMTVAGINMGRLLGGTIIIEFIFEINGLGGYVAQAIGQRDFLALQGGVLVIATGYVLINFAVDLLYAAVDPRIRHARAIA